MGSEKKKFDFDRIKHLRRLEAEKQCYELAKEIYQFLDRCKFVEPIRKESNTA